MFIFKRIKFFKEHWKLGIHLLLRTRRFGVNNERWSNFDSIFGVSKKQILKDILLVKPLFHNYKLMKFRAKSAYFVNAEEYELMFREKQDK